MLILILDQFKSLRISMLLLKMRQTHRYVYTYNPLEGVRNDRQYRKESIDEMRNMRLSRGSPGVYT